MKTVFFFFCCLLLHISFAQTLRSGYDGQAWRVIPPIGMWRNIQNSYGDYNQTRVAVSPNENVILVTYNNKECGALLIDNQLKVKWNTPVMGIPVQVGKFKNNILVISEVEDKKSKDYYGTIINPRDGKAVISKEITPSTKGEFLHFLFSNNDCKILATKYTLNTTHLEKMSLQTLTEDMTVATSTDMTFGNVELPLRQYKVNERGELFLVFAMRDDVYVQKYSASDYKLIGEQKFTIETHRSEGFDDMIFMPSSQNNNCLYLGFNYYNKDHDKAMGVYRIDFATKNILPITATVNKEYKRQVEGGYTKPLGMDKPYTKNWYDMGIVDLKEYKNGLVVYKEVIEQAIDGSTSRYRTMDAIIEVYDEAMKQTSQQLVTKSMELFQPYCLGSSLHIQGDNLYIVSSVITGVMSFKPLFVEYDLSKKILLKYNTLEKGSVDGNAAPDPKATLWFDDGFVLMNISPKAFLSNKIETSPQKFIY